MSRIRPEYLDPETSDRSLGANIRVREQPEEEEEDEEDDEKEDNEKRDDEDEGYSE